MVRDLMIETGVLNKRIEFGEYTDTRFSDKASIQTPWDTNQAQPWPGRSIAARDRKRREDTKMFRRRFLQLITLASANGLVSIESLAAEPTRTATYRVKGFSCITCATGLDTMLSHQKGIKSSKSTYPAGIVTVCFNPGQITGPRIVAFIEELGFTVTNGAKV